MDRLRNILLFFALLIVTAVTFDISPVRALADESSIKERDNHSYEQENTSKIRQLQDKIKENRKNKVKEIKEFTDEVYPDTVSDTELGYTEKDLKEVKEEEDREITIKYSGHTRGVSAEFLRTVSDINSRFVDGVKLIRKESEEILQEDHTLDIGTALRRVGALERRISTSTPNTPNIEDVDIKDDEHSGLRDTARAVRTLGERAQKLKDKARNAVSKDLNRVYTDISRKVRKKEDEDTRSFKLPKVSKEEVLTFVHEDREKKLEMIAKQLERKEEQIATYVDVVVDSSVRGGASPRALNNVLRSSMDEVETLIEAETGVDVDLSAYSRRVVREIKRETDDFEKQIEALNERGGLDLYRDTDEDGVSDYDEVNIYFTDPNNAFTAGSSLTDGERILLGFDAHSTSTERVAVESPITAGTVTDTIFEVNEIAVVDDKTMKFVGSALPNSFVTIYVYSTPIVVTVKADSTGKWEYTLDVQLEDGEHSLYVASVNNAGKILAKSTKVPFVKTAEAVDFTPLVSNVNEPTPLSVVQDNALIAGIFVFAIFAMIIVLTLGSWRARRGVESI